MLKRMRRHLSFANVMSVIAVFIAIGGGAYAAKKINGKTIKNNSIAASKLKTGVLTGLDKCPTAAPTNTGGICYGPAQAATDWDAAAQAGCRPQGLRLPTIGEALLVMTAVGGGSGNETWTDEIAELTTSRRAFVKAPGDPMGQIFTGPPAGPHAYRCIKNATN